MANAKITELPAIAAAATEDLVIIVDDPSGSPTSKKATLAQLGTAVLAGTTSSINTKRANGGVHFTDNAGTIGTPTALGVLGTTDFSVQCVVNMESYNSSGNTFWDSHNTGNNKIQFRAKSDGELQLRFWDNVGASSSFDLGVTPALGEAHDLMISCDRDGNASLYLNGVLAAAVDISSTSAIDIGASNSNAGRLGSDASFGMIGDMYKFRAFNFALSADQVLEIHRTGVPFEMQFGTTTDLIAPGTNNGGFETAGGGGADVFADWAEAVAGISTVNIETTSVVTGTNACRFDADGSGSNVQISQAGLCIAGKLFQYVAQVKVDDASAAPTMLIGDVGSAIETKGLPARGTITPTATYATYDGLLICGGNGAFVLKRQSNAANRSYFIDDLYWRRVGCVIDLDLGHGKGLHYPDFTDNEYHGTGTGTGVSNLIDKYVKNVDLAYSASLDVDFDDTPEKVKVGQLTGALTLTGSNYHENGGTVWRFEADATPRVITPPANWNDMNAVGTLTVAASKVAYMVIISNGTADTDCDFYFTAEA